LGREAADDEQPTKNMRAHAAPPEARIRLSISKLIGRFSHIRAVTAIIGGA
jgi:hypothetical protein